MSNKISLSAFLFGAGLLINISSFAQENLSGTWVLENKQLIAGPNYANSLGKQITITIQNDSIIFESINVDGTRNEIINRYSLPVNGQPLTSNKNNKKVIQTFQWNPDKMTGFVINRVYYHEKSSEEIDFTRIETWSFSPDGKQLIVDKKSVETRSQDWQVKGIFKKK